MLIVSFFILILNSWLDVMPQSTEQRHATPAKLGYSQEAPRFAQFPVRTKQQGERNWLSLGRCDQASDKASDRLVRKKARAQRPIFAGHYSIVVCSCGTECGGVSIVDLQSGSNFNFGDMSQECSRALGNYGEFLYFRVDGSLLILIGKPPIWKKGAGRNKGCAIRYYRRTGRRLVLLKERPISKNAAEQRHAPERAKQVSPGSWDAVRAPGDARR
jgi:hypothetical protein